MNPAAQRWLFIMPQDWTWWVWLVMTCLLLLGLTGVPEAFLAALFLLTKGHLSVNKGFIFSTAAFRPFSLKLIGQGLQTNQVYQSILTTEQLSLLEVSRKTEPFDGDPKKFRLGVEALRLGLALAREHDAYISLSIARVGPPHSHSPERSQRSQK